MRTWESFDGDDDDDDEEDDAQRDGGVSEGCTRVSDGASPATVAKLCCVSGGYRSRKSGMAAVPVSGRVSLLRSHGSG